MARNKSYLTAIMAVRYVKTIGPTAASFTLRRRIIAYLHDGPTEVVRDTPLSRKRLRARRPNTTGGEAARVEGV